MYSNRKNNIYPILSGALGVVTMVLRCGLYAAGLDEKNLLVPGHFLSLLVWISFLVAAVVIGVEVLRKNVAQWKNTGIKSGFLGALGALVLAAAIGWSVFAQDVPFTVVEKLNRIVGILCVPCLLVIAFCRLKGLRPFFLCHGVVCVYFCVHLVMCYGSWSANPQIQDYVFATLACACIALFAYQQTAMDVDMGNGKLQYALGLLAGYLGIAATYGMAYFWLYPAAGFWALTNLTGPEVAKGNRNGEEN